MKPFWVASPMAARDVYQRVPKEYGWAYKTVKTMLARLVKKGALKYRPIGNAYLYEPAFTKEELQQAAMESFVRHVVNGSLATFAASLAGILSAEELRSARLELVRLERLKKNEKPKP